MRAVDRVKICTEVLKITSVFCSCSGRRNGTWTCADVGNKCIRILHRPDEKLNREIVSALQL